MKKALHELEFVEMLYFRGGGMQSIKEQFRHFYYSVFLNKHHKIVFQQFDN